MAGRPPRRQARGSIGGSTWLRTLPSSVDPHPEAGADDGQRKGDEMRLLQAPQPSPLLPEEGDGELPGGIQGKIRREQGSWPFDALAEHPQNTKHGEIPEGFIGEHRLVTDRSIWSHGTRAEIADSPGQARLLAQGIAGHKAPEPADRLAQNDAGCCGVREAEQRSAAQPGDGKRRNDTSEQGSADRQSALL